MGSVMVMGRKTFDSLPGLLPGRRHIVLTRNRGWSAPGAEVAHDVDDALALAGEDARVSVIGGAEVFGLFLPLATRIELTEVLADYDGETAMPDPRTGGKWLEAGHEEHARRGRPAAVPLHHPEAGADLAVENGVDLLGDGLDRGHAVDLANQPARFVIRQDRRGLGAIFGHPGAHRCVIVVGPALEFDRPAHIAHAADPGQLEAVVIAGAAARAAEAADDPLDQFVLVDHQLDDMAERAVVARQQGGERHRLFERARIAVEDHALVGGQRRRDCR